MCWVLLCLVAAACVHVQPGGSGPGWGSLDDVVMGGVSSSRISKEGGAGEGGSDAMVFRWLQGSGVGGYGIRAGWWRVRGLGGGGVQVGFKVEGWDWVVTLE